MKFLFSTIFFLSVFILFENRSFALSNYQIKEICQKKRKRYQCIKNLQFKRHQLLKGKRIKIPVIKFKE